MSPAKAGTVLSPAFTPGAGKHIREVARTDHVGKRQKAPLHRWEKQDEGSQQAQTAQSFQRTPQAMIESPARGGARGPGYIP